MQASKEELHKMGDEMKKAEEEYQHKLDAKKEELERHEREFEAAERKKAAAEASKQIHHMDDAVIAEEISRVLNKKLKNYKDKLDKEVIKEATEEVKSNVK